MVLVALVLPVPAAFGDALPQLPFHGVYGGTLGAGSLTGWERHGGDNPAVLSGMSEPGAASRAGMSAAVAGYVPFGLEELRVAEVMAARDGDAFGVSLRWTVLRDFGSGEGVDGENGVRTPGRSAGRVRGQAAWRPLARHALSVGAHAAVLSGGPSGAAGLLWRPFPFLGWGVEAEAAARPGEWTPRAAALRLGMDAGAAFGGGGTFRVAVERHVERDVARAGAVMATWRLGGMLRPHPLLAVTAGWLPGAGQVALGVRFGAGSLTLASALRRHALLGGTPVQSLEWSARQPP